MTTDSVGENGPAADAAGRPLPTSGPSFTQRWLTPRALLLHLEVAIVAPGCAVAGWWQATRALAGNGLSWVYSVEWPAFAVIAVVVWWHLIHEDRAHYEARRVRRATVASVPADGPAASPRPLVEGDARTTVEPGTIRAAKRLALAIGVESALGIAGLVTIPYSRPSGWLPTGGEAIYVAHAVVGLAIVAGALVLALRARAAGRMSRLVGTLGFLCICLAGVGGLLTEPRSLVRFVGITFMFVGAALAECAYLIPTILNAQRKVSAGSDLSGGAEASAGDQPVVADRPVTP